jgi:hypothetical protein
MSEKQRRKLWAEFISFLVGSSEGLLRGSEKWGNFLIYSVTFTVWKWGIFIDYLITFRARTHQSSQCETRMFGSLIRFNTGDPITSVRANTQGHKVRFTLLKFDGTPCTTVSYTRDFRGRHTVPLTWEKNDNAGMMWVLIWGDDVTFRRALLDLSTGRAVTQKRIRISTEP